MARKPSTTVSGGPFSPAVIEAVWQKGRTIEDENPAFTPDRYRRDRCDTAMRRSDYGKRDSQFGWEIDHMNPIANGGSDDIGNLQPLNWRNNVEKSDTYPWNCGKPVAPSVRSIKIVPKATKK